MEGEVDLTWHLVVDPRFYRPLNKSNMSDKKEKPWFIVRRSEIHSRGIFARRDIPNDTRILEYTGERVTKAESQRRATARIERAKKTGRAAVFIFDINKKHDIDGGVRGNVARLMNHSCDPNCEAFIMRGRVWIYSRRKIAAGEELTYNYGFDLEHWSEHPCLCGCDNCVGFIVDRKYWRKLRDIIAKLKASREAALRATVSNGVQEHPEVIHGHAKQPSKKKTARRTVKRVR